MNDGLRRLASPLAWTVFIALPVRGWGWLDGVPIGPLEAAAIALVWWVWAADRQLPSPRLLAGLTIAKLLLGALLVDGGLAAQYYANDTWTPPVERSIEFRRPDITRVDKTLAFGSTGQPDLPLYFLNDLRFNFYRPDEPKRDLLAYSVMWHGFVRSDRSRQETFYLTASDGVAGDLAIDDRVILSLNGASERSASITLSEGWHPITIRVAAPYGSGRQVEAGRVVGGLHQPLGAPDVLITPASRPRLALGVAVRWFSGGADALILAWIVVLVGTRARNDARDRQVGHLLWLGVIVEALVFALRTVDRVPFLSGGDDWLVYESFGRSIALGDLLLLQGRAIGQGAPFYFQPLYPYFVAFTHLVFGDAIFGVALVQRALIGAATGWCASITTRLLGTTAGWVALFGGGLFLYEKAGRWSDVLLAEPLFTPLLVAWMWLLIRSATERPSWPTLFSTGVVGGIATLVRSTLLIGWIPLLPAWFVSIPARRIRVASVVIVTMIGVVGTATVRNWIVSRTFVVTSSSGAVNLVIGNNPPRPLAPPPPDRQALYDRRQLSPYARTFSEYVIQMPKAFVAGLGRKALYSVGLFDLSGIKGDTGTSWWYVAMWLAALAGAIRLQRSDRRPGAVVLLPAIAALSHFAVVVLFFPQVYGDRLILPMYPMLIPYGAFALEPAVSVWRRVTTWLAQREALAGSAVLGMLGLFIVLIPPDQALNQMMILIAVAASFATIAGRERPIWERTWLYLGYMFIFVMLAFTRERAGAGNVVLTHYLLLPVAAFAVAELAGNDVVRRVLLATLAVGPLLGAALAGRLSQVNVRLLLTNLAVIAAAISFARLTPWSARRVAASVAVCCVVLVLAIPFFPWSGLDMADRFQDIRRDFPHLDAGGDDARQELTSDAREALQILLQPFASVFSILTRNGDTLSVFCLLALWVHIVFAHWRTRVASFSILAAVCAAFIAAYLMTRAGSPGPLWGGAGYSLASLAILLGLTHARVSAAASPMTCT